MRRLFLLSLLVLFSASLSAQVIEKISFDPNDTTGGYYLAIRPRSHTVKGVLVLFNSFAAPEGMLPETKLHNTAYANDLLTIAVSMKEKLYADTPAVARLNAVLAHVVSRFGADPSKFVLAGYDFAGTIALRYTEYAKEQPSRFPVLPKAVVAIDSPVDLFGLWNWSERQVRRRSRSMGDATYILDLLKRETGTIRDNKARYEALTPFHRGDTAPGNERFLVSVPVRLYYDVDVEGGLANGGNSLFDTHIPDGSELVSRLLAAGNSEAELVTAKTPGRNSRGIRTTNALSIVDEVDFIHWMKKKLGIFDAHTWVPPYFLPEPKGWEVERFPIPIEFAPSIPYTGVEDVRFTPGWGDSASEEYWSYAFLWWLQGEQTLNAQLLESHLKAYYEGLVGRNIVARKIPAEKVVPTRVQVKMEKGSTPSLHAYTGTVRMLDYMTGKPITLNCRIRVQSCPGQGHTAVFTELSPKGYSHPVWTGMSRIRNSFRCER